MPPAETKNDKTLVSCSICIIKGFLGNHNAISDPLSLFTNTKHWARKKWEINLPQSVFVHYYVHSRQWRWHRCFLTETEDPGSNPGLKCFSSSLLWDNHLGHKAFLRLLYLHLLILVESASRTHKFFLLSSSALEPLCKLCEVNKWSIFITVPLFVGDQVIRMKLVLCVPSGGGKIYHVFTSPRPLK